MEKSVACTHSNVLKCSTFKCCSIQLSYCIHINNAFNIQLYIQEVSVINRKGYRGNLINYSNLIVGLYRHQHNPTCKGLNKQIKETLEVKVTMDHVFSGVTNACTAVIKESYIVLVREEAIRKGFYTLKTMVSKNWFD